jgi:hypothetical protein
MLAAQLFQVIEKVPNVGLRADKRVTDKIRVLDDELQRFQVIGSERRQVDPRVGEVNALFGAKFFPVGMCLHDFNGCGIRVHRAKDATDLAVVEPDWFARFGVIEYLRQRDANPGGSDDCSRLAIRSRPHHRRTANEKATTGVSFNAPQNRFGSPPRPRVFIVTPKKPRRPGFALCRVASRRRSFRRRGSDPRRESAVTD